MRKRVVLLIIGYVLLFFLLGEICFRVFMPKNDRTRHLFFSSETWEKDKEGAVRYVKNKNIRSLTVYGDQIDYDVMFQTNNLGLIDHKDYYSRPLNDHLKKTAIVGDSYTAGFHGGSPWVPKLRDKVSLKFPNIEIYNLGVGGTGVYHFQRLLKSISSQLSFNRILIVSISNDFHRPYWTPQMDADRIHFCIKYPSRTFCGDPVASVIDLDTTADDIRKSISLESKKISTETQVTDCDLKCTLKKSKFLKVVVRYFKMKYKVQKSINALRDLKNTFSGIPITVVQLPSKSEFIKGKYLYNLKTRIEDAGLGYFSAFDECQWSRDMYLEFDGHPNAKGYQNIADCLEKEFFSSSIGE